MRTLTARWVFPVTGAPIEDGAVAIDGGRIFRVAVAAGHIRRTDPVGSLLDGTCGADVLLSLIDGTVRYSRSEVVACA